MGEIKDTAIISYAIVLSMVQAAVSRAEAATRREADVGPCALMPFVGDKVSGYGGLKLEAMVAI